MELKSVYVKRSNQVAMLKFALIASMLTSLSACAEPKLVPNLQDGQAKSAICGQCHGKNGIAIIPIYPNLAGQKKGYMELQLYAFRAGQRINAAMTPHAKRLTDQDIVDLSAYYANMDPSGKKTNTQVK
jgi:cytochrome c553